MMNKPLDETVKAIEKFLALKIDDTKKGNKLGKKIIKIAADIRALIIEKELKKKFQKIISRLKNYSSRLSRDVLNSENGPLNRDWEQFARQDLSRLKDEVLALQEFLIEHEAILQKRQNERRYGLDFKELARRIRKEDSIDEITRSQFLRTVDKLEVERIGEFKNTLLRISKWLFALKELKTEVENVAQ
ncbi:hypothetical protein AKJ57_03235 [candidate division MSBL1 archaeon SCGC-AAA259A05]|uniref:Uncharacterized protein n=1 Tax=candidate division MSBL1 archaeon SCGC-AAA259A05 TaxID=1698259 RepID=A0A133U9N8_9EURY|nr:hypothetical protein AKJ57_03235 [candidate division MSBL1 archaeon SCGC-AAA259A05]